MRFTGTKDSLLTCVVSKSLFIGLIFWTFTLFQSTTFAQSQDLKLDLLQGKWMFRALHAQVNSDISANTTSFNPWNIHFEIRKDTCTMIRLREITSKIHRYDTTFFTIELLEDNLLFFLINKSVFKKPAYQLQIKQLNNQTVTFIDSDAAQGSPSLLVNAAELSFTFSRHADLYQTTINPQRQLKGKWYVSENFLVDIKAQKDTILATNFPRSYEKTIDFFETACDTVLRYYCLKIGDETWKIKDSVAFKPCTTNNESVGAIEAPEEFLSLVDFSIYYYIIPDMQIIELSIPKLTGEKDSHGMPMVERNKVLYHYKFAGKQFELFKVTNR